MTANAWFIVELIKACVSVVNIYTVEKEDRNISLITAAWKFAANPTVKATE